MNDLNFRSNYDEDSIMQISGIDTIEDSYLNNLDSYYESEEYTLYKSLIELLDSMYKKSKYYSLFELYDNPLHKVTNQHLVKYSPFKLYDADDSDFIEIVDEFLKYFDFSNGEYVFNDKKTVFDDIIVNELFKYNHYYYYSDYDDKLKKYNYLTLLSCNDLDNETEPQILLYHNKILNKNKKISVNYYAEIFSYFYNSVLNQTPMYSKLDISKAICEYFDISTKKQIETLWEKMYIKDKIDLFEAAENTSIKEVTRTLKEYKTEVLY